MRPLWASLPPTRLAELLEEIAGEDKISAELGEDAPLAAPPETDLERLKASIRASRRSVENG